MTDCKLAENRLYGRSKGRPLSQTQARLMKDIYPNVEVSPDKMDMIFASPKPSTKPSTKLWPKLWFEIGFGGAEHLIWQARHNPEALLIGAEPFLNGVAKAVVAIHTYKLSNVRLWQGDARDIIAHLPHESLERVFILFPDPWPKTRHNKRRIISESFVNDIYKVIEKGGRFRFASDIEHYVDWTLTHICAHGGFNWPASSRQDWRERPDDWPETRYEAKAKREGRPCHYFEFIRI